MGLAPFVGAYAAYNTVLFLGIVVAALGAYYLCWVVTGKRGAAVVAAAAYAYAPHSYAVLFESLTHIDVLLSYALLPLVIALWENLISRPTRPHIVLASLGAIGVMLSYPQTGLYAALWLTMRLAFYTIGVLLGQEGARPHRVLAAGGAAAVLALAVLLPLYVPALLFRPISRSYEQTKEDSIQALTPSVLGEILVVGVLVALAIVSYSWLRHRKLAPADWTLISFLPIIAYFAMLAQGPFGALSVFRFSFDYIPLMQTIRAPARALNITILGLAVVAGYSFDYLAQRIPRTLGLARPAWAVMFSWMATALVIGQYWMMIQNGKGWPVYPPVSFLKKTLDISVGPIARIASDPEPARVLTLPQGGAAAVMGAVAKPDVTGARTSDFDPRGILYKSKAELASTFSTSAPNIANQAAMFGVKYVLVYTDTAASADYVAHLENRPTEFRLLSSESGWFTFKNLRFRGMAFELCPPGQPCDPVAIDYQRPDANTIRLSFDSDRKARLLVSETYHQGWAVNDPRVKVGQEESLFALEVEQPGHYEITLRYQLYDQFLPWVGLGWGGWGMVTVALLLPWRRLGAGLARRPPS